MCISGSWYLYFNIHVVSLHLRHRSNLIRYIGPGLASISKKSIPCAHILCLPESMLSFQVCAPLHTGYLQPFTAMTTPVHAFDLFLSLLSPPVRSEADLPSLQHWFWKRAFKTSKPKDSLNFPWAFHFSSLHSSALCSCTPSTWSIG